MNFNNFSFQGNISNLAFSTVIGRIRFIFKNLNLFSKLAKNSKFSILANVSPRHLLAPIPKGMFLLILFTNIVQLVRLQDPCKNYGV